MSKVNTSKSAGSRLERAERAKRRIAESKQKMQTTREMEPARAALPPTGQMPLFAGGFNIPAPRGVVPVMNPRVPVGDERLEEEEFSPVPASMYPEDEEGQEEQDQEPDEPEPDPQDEIEEMEFSPVPAPMTRGVHTPRVAPLTTQVPTVRTAAAKPKTRLTLPAISIEDADRLWDWVRQDADKGAIFFGKPIENSMQLHDLMKGLIAAEQSGTGCVRAILWGETQLGILVMQPILSVERVAVANIYLAPEVRPNMPQLIRPIIQLACVLVPGYHIAMLALTKAQHDLFTAQLPEFKSHTLFIL